MSAKKAVFRDYQEEDPAKQVTSQDFQNIQTLWKDIHDNRRNYEDLKTYKGPHPNLVNYDYVRALERENNTLKDQIKYLEGLLTSSKETNRLLHDKLSNAEDVIEKMDSQIAKQGNVSAMQTNQINQLTSKFNNITYSQRDLTERAKLSSQVLAREVEDKSDEVEKLKYLLHDRTNKLGEVSVAYDQQMSKNTLLETEAGLKDRQIISLLEKADQAEKKINELTFSRATEGASLVEVEHLRADVQRLLKMLRSTEEYKDFADFADDTTGSIRFLKSLKKTAPLDLGKIRSSLSPKSVRRGCHDSEDPLLAETDKWIPREAFKFVQEFRRNYNGELTDTLIEKLLFELNRIWSRREQARLSRVKSQYAAEVQRLQRQIVSMPSHKEVESKKTITRLRTDLKSAHSENRKAFAERTPKNPPGIHYISETMRLANQNIRNKKDLQKENEILREKLKMQEQGKNVPEAHINGLDKELLRFRSSLGDVITDFSKKKKEILDLYEGKPDIGLILRKEDWFLENLDTVVQNLMKSVNSLQHKTSLESKEFTKSLIGARFK